MNKLFNSLLFSSFLVLASCSGGGGGGGDKGSKDPDVAAENFTNNVTISGATLEKGAPPSPTPGFTIDSAAGSSSTVYGGSQNPLSVDLTGLDVSSQNQSANSTINLAFNGQGSGAAGASGYFAIPVQTSQLNIAAPVLNTSFTVDPDVCNNLADIQHQIDCYESVTLPDGTTVSKSQAQQMVLACNTGDFKGAGSFCAYNYPKDACDIIQSSYAGTFDSVAFVPGTGSGTCDAFGNVADKYDYGYTGNEGIGSVGACILAP